MIDKLRKSQTSVLAVIVLAIGAWLAADAAEAQGRSGSSSRSSSSAKGSSSSGSSSKGSSVSSGSSSRRAVSRSGSSRGLSARSAPAGAHGGSGAARTRTGHSRDRGRRGGGYGGVHIGYGYGGYGYGYGFGYRYPSYWHPFWGYWGWGYGPSVVVHSNRPAYGMGAVDLKVRPKNTEIYVDGQYVGLAKQYDGFPGYLWLDRGVYEIAFYKPGFETQTRTIKIMNRLVLDMEVDMLEGEALQPELRYQPQAPEESGEEIVSRLRGTRDGVELARLHLSVEPASAEVYLDGNLLGTGEELAGLHGGLLLSAGVHRLEVVRDGYETLEHQLVADAGAGLELQLELRPLDRSSS